MNRLFMFASATTILVIGSACGPTAQGGGGGSASASTSAAATGGSSALGAGGDATDGGPGSAGGESLPGSGGGRAWSSPPGGPVGEPAAACDVCSAALGDSATNPLCGPSQTEFDSFLACACTAACASACGDGSPGNCLAAWQGNPPLACKTCLVSATGCGGAWNTCVADDGVTPPPGSSSSTGGGPSPCVCEAGAPLCAGGGSCATPGPFDGAGNAACGSAEYCAPCCDPGNACAVQGSCQLTKIDQTHCAADYECCSGVCTAGKCDGGCGIILSF